MLNSEGNPIPPPPWSIEVFPRKMWDFPLWSKDAIPRFLLSSSASPPPGSYLQKSPPEKNIWFQHWPHVLCYVLLFILPIYGLKEVSLYIFQETSHFMETKLCISCHFTAKPWYHRYLKAKCDSCISVRHYFRNEKHFLIVKTRNRFVIKLQQFSFFHIYNVNIQLRSLLEKKIRVIVLQTIRCYKM